MNTNEARHEAEQEHEDAPPMPRFVHLLPEDIEDKRKVIVILEKAGVQSAMIKKEAVLLNSDEHAHYIQSQLGREPSDYRPDITHQCLLALLDSPLNKAGLLKVYVSTIAHQIIEINPHTRIPRTYRRFAPLMVQLLKRLRIRAEQCSTTLLKIIKNPITQYLPTECLKLGTSTKARHVNMTKFAADLPNNQPVVFVVGAVAKGNPAMEVDYINDSICISKYPLSAAYAISKILAAFEAKWDVL